MKILFYFPDWGNVAQNRQYQKNNSKIYPVLLAMQATWLHQHGHAVYWDQPIFHQYDHVIVESKYATHARTLELQKKYPNVEILGEVVGDGVSRLCPREFNKLPAPDRRLTKWENYSRNGNYKYLPGTHIQSARDCWWGRCEFCSWAQLYPHEFYERRTPENVIAEIQDCVDLGIKEIFDDSGTFPVGHWLADFCDLMIKSGLNKKVKISCNMRFSALCPAELIRMKSAGFRMLLWGLEQYDQYTLMIMKKGIDFKLILPTLTAAHEAGLENHVAVMYGIPWLPYQNEKLTYQFLKDMMKCGRVDSVQATLFTPYPNTPMYRSLKESGLVMTDNPDDYDMSISVTNADKNKIGLMKRTYRLALHPQFIWNKMRSIRSMDDFKFYLRAFKKICWRLR